MAPSNAKMEIPESPIREGDTPSSTESETESGVVSKSTLPVGFINLKVTWNNTHNLVHMYKVAHQIDN